MNHWRRRWHWGAEFSTLQFSQNREKARKTSFVGCCDDEAVHHSPCVPTSCCVDARQWRHGVNTSCLLLNDDTFVWQETPVDYLDVALTTRKKKNKREKKRDTDSLRHTAGVYFSRGWCGFDMVWLTLRKNILLLCLSFYLIDYVCVTLVIHCCWEGFILNLLVKYYAHFKPMFFTMNSGVFKNVYLAL